MSTSTLKSAVEAVCLKEYSLPKTCRKHFFSRSHRHNMKEILSLFDNSGNTRFRFSVRTVKLAVAVVILSVFAMLGSATKQEGFVIQHMPEADIYLAADATDAPKSLEEYYTITYVPEGFVLDSDKSVISKFSNTRYFHTDYNEGIDEKSVFCFSQGLKRDCRLYIDNERSVHQKVTVNGRPGIYVDFPRDDAASWGILMWDNGDYILSVDGNLDKNELMKIAKSTKIEKY